MHKARAAAVLTLAILIVAVVGVFAWATHHPDHHLVLDARDRPLIGVLADWIHRTYGAPADDLEPEAPTVELRQGVAPGGELLLAKPWVWVKPGMPLRRGPSVDSPVIAVFDVYTNLPQVEDRDGWERVHWRGHDGWLPPPPEDGPRLGRATEAPGPLAPRAPDPNRLAHARALLGADAITRPLGPYTLYTNSTNGYLIERLGRLAPQLDRLYVDRFGRHPVGTPREAVVLFSREAAYRRLQASSAPLAGVNAAGHSGWGLAVLYQGERSLEDVAATFVHEITHLMNRRAIGPALPPWLDEGLAEALASGRIQPWGALEPRQWGGYRRKVGQRIEVSGVRAALQRVARAIRANTLPRLGVLATLDADRFMRDTDGAGTRYAAAGLFIRYLLDADDARWADGFLSFLDDVAQGGQASGEALLTRLDTNWSALDDGFRSWVLDAIDGSSS